MRKNFKEYFIEYNHWISIGLILFLGVWGYIGLTQAFSESTTNSYLFHFNDRPEIVNLDIYAPKGFEQGETVRLDSHYIKNDYKMNSTKEDPILVVLNRDAATVMPGNRSFGENLFHIKDEYQVGESLSFELERSTKLAVVYKWRENGMKFYTASEKIDLEVRGNDGSKFLIGLVALIALLLTVPSSVESFCEMWKC